MSEIKGAVKDKFNIQDPRNKKLVVIYKNFNSYDKETAGEDYNYPGEGEDAGCSSKELYRSVGFQFIKFDSKGNISGKMLPGYDGYECLSSANDFRFVTLKAGKCLARIAFHPSGLDDDARSKM